MVYFKEGAMRLALVLILLILVSGLFSWGMRAEGQEEVSMEAIWELRSRVLHLEGKLTTLGQEHNKLLDCFRTFTKDEFDYPLSGVYKCSQYGDKQ